MTQPQSSEYQSPPTHFTTSASRPSKTSLGFICSPSTSINHSRSHQRSPSFPPSSSTNSALNLPSRSDRRLSRLELLPREVLTLIAHNLVVTPTNRGYHPSPLIPFFLTSRKIYDPLSFDSNPQLYNGLFRCTFDNKALDRRYQWMVQHLAVTAGRGRKIFDLFSDPRSWAIDYKTRWEQSWRMRQVAGRGVLDIPGICTRDQVTADLWNVWFILTENDGKNLSFLAEQCHFQVWIVVWYREDVLKDSLVPGYPKETGEKALGFWCALLSGTDLSAEQTAEEVDEKIFVMRPFVFACAKYDVTYAPWHHRRLPLCLPECKDHEIGISLQFKALPYKRFGYTWRRSPPHFILGCYLGFLRLLERQPHRMSVQAGSSSFSNRPNDPPEPGLFSITRILPSIYHDREWQRNTVCQDPHTSPGLPPLTFRGEVEGFWRAKFLYYDFHLYREILAGNMRTVYTGTFAEQAAEMDLKETVIKVKLEDVGGKGPMLCAGFKEENEHDGEDEVQRIRQGYGYEIVQDENQEDKEGWTKEILISGRARSSWGWMTVRGRIRAWDGLVMLSLTYKRPMTSRWLWRGYLHTGGHIVGRWRDTFTPEDQRGYEGAFGMIRSGDIFYPPHFPKTMEESLGVNDNGQIVSGAIPGILHVPQASRIRTSAHPNIGGGQASPIIPPPAPEWRARGSSQNGMSGQPSPSESESSAGSAPVGNASGSRSGSESGSESGPRGSRLRESNARGE